MLPGICGIGTILIFAVMMISATVHFSLDELNDTDFSEEKKERRFYDHYTDESAHEKRTFFSVIVVSAVLLSVISFWLFTFLSESVWAESKMRVLWMVIGVILMLILFLGIGIYLPYYLSFQKPKESFLRWHRFYRVFELLLYPLTAVANGISVLFSVLLGSDPRKATDDVTEEDVIDLVHEGHEQGVFKASEATMIKNIFEFDDKIAKDIMINRKNMVALDGETDFKETVHFFNENHFSRIPVYLDDLDNIIGIIHMKEVLKFSDRSDLYHTRIKDFSELMKEAEFVPETHGINTLFTQMQLSKNHLIIVVDEYGQTSGLVTMEDILEEIVGNIFDEHDEEKDKVRQLKEDHFMMQGSTPMEEVTETLKIPPIDCEFETLNGFLTDQYGSVPEDGGRFSIEAFGFRFDVLNVENRIITDIAVSKLTETPEEP